MSTHLGRRVVPVGVLVAVVAVVVASVPLYVRPATDAPQQAGAVVVLGDSGAQQLDKGISLVKAGFARTLVVSTANRYGCPPPIPSVAILCFSPEPATTQGEARFASTVAIRRGWKRIIVVPSTAQTTRARIRFKRCFSGTILMDPADPVGLGAWAYRIAYEWAATVKALTLQRGC